MEYAVGVCRLSSEFYANYPSSAYPELLLKDKRAYTCLLIEAKDDCFICVPFRSNILHKDAFLFKNTRRSAHTPSGLDYTKIVIIKDMDYIDSTTSAVVDNDEYVAMIKNIEKIVTEVMDYVGTYINHINKTSVLHQREFARHYQYSTLQYFHKELNL